MNLDNFVFVKMENFVERVNLTKKSSSSSIRIKIFAERHLPLVKFSQG